jgi:shikimate dehydrogenase
MHAAAFAALELPWQYVAFRVRPQDLEAAVRGLRALDVAGVNVTVPHKESVVAYLDRVDSAARRIGAVNTVRREGDALVGYNTDAPGLLDTLRERGLSLPGTRALIVGAGGAGRSAAFALAGAGARAIVILNRMPGRAQEVAARVAEAHPAQAIASGPLDPDTVARAVEEADVIIQATSVTLSAAMGGGGGHAPWLLALHPLLRRGMTVLDMVYAPRRTELLAAAEEAGAHTVDGVSLLLHQGARSFELWTGRPAPLAAMRRAVDAPERPS